MANGITLKTPYPQSSMEGGSIMFWGSFSSSGVGSLHKVDGIMKKIRLFDYFANLFEGRC